MVGTDKDIRGVELAFSTDVKDNRTYTICSRSAPTMETADSSNAMYPSFDCWD